MLAQSEVETSTQISESGMEDDIEVPILDESDGRVYQSYYKAILIKVPSRQKMNSINRLTQECKREGMMKT